MSQRHSAPAGVSHGRDAVLIGLDWGSSSCRAYLYAADGSVIGFREASCGVARLHGGPAAPEPYEEAFLAMCGPWLAEQPGLPVLACGMVGSDRGWAHVPHRRVPASIDDPGPAACVRTRDEVDIHILPGFTDAGGPGGVMRGEETQLAGLSVVDREAVVLPGTHSKWVRLSGRTVTGFTTYMTGELYALVTAHSVLAGSIEPADEPAWSAFERGVRYASEQPCPSVSLFSARTRWLAADLRGDEVADYVSGLLIGTELLDAQSLGGADPAAGLLIAGGQQLNLRYERAATALGWQAVRAVADASARGLWASAGRLGLVTAPVDSAGGR
jgi:2-dehydro-3-deoxygalactonokinase